ncbi:hypothetical protein UFOVP411_28 [uncultured Caudovirales phage]|uniref:Uncharacterized protein n=1 Tax=uncultured Caudovirales phage TaxID=2100421 RepID=A0A6J5M2Q8_9CAUD|nr:hypothetical protein UFOVP411_28 [uncultured Caudovirales phage]
MSALFDINVEADSRNGTALRALGTLVRRLDPLGTRVLPPDPARPSHARLAIRVALPQGLARDLDDLCGYLFMYCTAAGEDCVAVAAPDGTSGLLVGPRADQWAPFNPSFFVPYGE